ncbi:DDE-type integrase/transposase/recombinase [Aeromonas media]|uniref:DDE-type integrase/transposase/recombinase n=1 Tax=Aeromonas media TaxID=651 RepID=UPI003990A275
MAYIRTHEGWLYLAAVLDLFSRQAIGWSMGPRIDRELAISVLLMAVWRRRPEQEVPVYSDLTAMTGRIFCESTYSRPV